jgi:hypothetical protein
MIEDWAEYPDRGLVRRELYPWNDHEPGRYSDETIGFLNKQLWRVAPKLEVKVTELADLTTPSERQVQISTHILNPI